MRIEIRPAALADLREIWFFGADRWGVAQADGYQDDLNAAIKSLAEWPEAWPRSVVRPDIRRMVHASHIVYFRTSSEVVTVVRVLHHSRDPGRHLA